MVEEKHLIDTWFFYETNKTIDLYDSVRKFSTDSIDIGNITLFFDDGMRIVAITIRKNE